MKKTVFYLFMLASSMAIFALLGFYPTDCAAPGSEKVSCTTVSFADKTEVLEEDCSWNGIPLYGKVKFVESFPDIKIQYVESFPDLKVKFVDSFADNCGEWQVVESFPDIKIQVVESFPDIKVKVVESFPGMP
jgi:hypothetical protein